jgi:solute carrier family 13 (sodium-dependent dicarboxylate transporter), member 2/3/5
MINLMKKNQFWISFYIGAALALSAYLLNPFALKPDACKAVAVAILMIIWWITEALPMPVVALVPLVLLPLLQISTIEEVAKAYSNPVIFLFMGGFMIGLAIEKWNLHKRIALQIVKHTGTSGDRIILGFIISTGFLSMWLSNTATTMMMFPIALSVIAVMKEHEKPGRGLKNFSLVLMLVIAYASNIGGMATVIGTPPNVVLVGYIEKRYGYTVQFLNWMILCVPIAMVLLAALYLVLTKWLFPNRIKSSKETHSMINREITGLGKLSTAEKRVLFVFLATALMWITRDFINKLGLFRLDDNMIAIIGAVALFATPSGKKAENNIKMLLDWSDTSKMAWGILLLFGGGIALANSLEKVGVMEQIGNWLAGFGQTGGFALVLLIVVISIFLSEVMSNVAQVIVLAPVLAALADALHLNPLLLGLPMTLAASAASMMPMGTPPNAIVFGSGYIRLKDMLKAGFVMNLVSIIVITLFIWFLLPLLMALKGG